MYRQEAGALMSDLANVTWPVGGRADFCPPGLSHYYLPVPLSPPN